MKLTEDITSFTIYWHLHHFVISKVVAPFIHIDYPRPTKLGCLSKFDIFFFPFRKNRVLVAYLAKEIFAHIFSCQRVETQSKTVKSL